MLLALILRGVSYHRHISPFPDTTLHRLITCLKGHQRIFQGSSGHPSCHLQAQGQPSISLPYAAGTLRHAPAQAAPDTNTEAVPQPKEEAWQDVTDALQSRVALTGTGCPFLHWAEALGLEATTSHRKASLQACD